MKSVLWLTKLHDREESGERRNNLNGQFLNLYADKFLKALMQIAHIYEVALGCLRGFSTSYAFDDVSEIPSADKT